MAGGGANYEDEGAVIADINVTPLVDVTLVLLIIMMVTAPMLSEPTAIKVDLPKGKTGEAAPANPESKTLLVGKGGQIQFDGATVSMEQLKEKLAQVASGHPMLEVGVAADKGAEYGEVMQVLDTIRAAGVSRFSLQMEDDGQGGGLPAAVPAGVPAGAPAAAQPAGPAPAGGTKAPF
jgi:biopolymer transport protein ExbD